MNANDVLDGGLLTTVALGPLNLAFLDLATELAEEGRLRQISGLPSRAIDALIDPGAGRRLCERLPYALFDLRFDDGAFWQGEVAAAGGVQDAGHLPAADDRIVAFVRAVIMLAWHLAQTRAAGARLVFGTVPATIAALSSMPVATVERLRAVIAARSVPVCRGACTHRDRSEHRRGRSGRARDVDARACRRRARRGRYYCWYHFLSWHWQALLRDPLTID